MALIIDVSIELKTGRTTLVPEARFWVDSQSERGLNSEIELPLKRGSGNSWSGTLAIEKKSSQLLYRLGLLAHAGAVWSLTIRNRTQRYTLLSDTDELGAGKAWLTGLCPLPRANVQARQCIGAGSRLEPPLDGVGRRPPYLLLLDR